VINDRTFSGGEQELIDEFPAFSFVLGDLHPHVLSMPFVMLAMGLARQGAVRRREDIEIAMEESMMEIVPQLEKRTHYLATLANVATLLGLLGTVSGLISAFAAVATVNPAEKANLLSASISEAMNCTAFGLVTAVPFLILHALLQTKTTRLIESLESVSIKFLTALTSRQRTVLQGPVALPRAVNE